jgi:hypothetical protein
VEGEIVSVSKFQELGIEAEFESLSLRHFIQQHTEIGVWYPAARTKS